MNLVNRRWVLKSRPVGDIDADVLSFEDSPVPDLPEGHVLARNIYLSLDPTNRIWMSDMEQYLPPVELGEVMRGGTVAVVEESRAEGIPVGALISPGLGGWQDYAIVSQEMVRILPVIPGLSATAYLSALGATGITAYFGLLDIAKPQPGETLVVSSAAGAVGSIVGQIGKIKGCRVIGIAGGPDKCRWLTEELGFDGAIDYKNEDVGAALDRLCPDGIDINFENVGGPIMDEVMARMNNFSRMPLCGMISTYNSTDAIVGPAHFQRVLMRRILIKGFIVIDYLDRAGEAIADLALWVMSGQIKYKVHVEQGLENAAEAVKLLFSGQHDGKLVVQISKEPV
jgi:NADPH-dependent curcumin reductase